MKNQTRREKKIPLPMRHSPSVKKTVDELAAVSNVDPGTLYRTIFNAGLTALYGFEIRDNQIISRDAPPAS